MPVCVHACDGCSGTPDLAGVPRLARSCYLVSTLGCGAPHALRGGGVAAWGGGAWGVRGSRSYLCLGTPLCTSRWRL